MYTEKGSDELITTVEKCCLAIERLDRSLTDLQRRQNELLAKMENSSTTVEVHELDEPFTQSGQRLLKTMEITFDGSLGVSTDKDSDSSESFLDPEESLPRVQNKRPVGGLLTIYSKLKTLIFPRPKATSENQETSSNVSSQSEVSGLDEVSSGRLRVSIQES